MAEIYNDGLCTLCDCRDHAGPGGMPALTLTPLITSYFAELEIGINRLYLAKGADEKIDFLIRVPDEGIRPAAGGFVVLSYYNHEQDHENGDQYRITAVQPKHNADDLPVFDLQLERLKENYAIHRVI